MHAYRIVQEFATMHKGATSKILTMIALRVIFLANVKAHGTGREGKESES
jgi:hypothetical protein